MTRDSRTPEQAPRKPLSAPLSAEPPSLGISGGARVASGPQAGVQPIQPLDLIRDAIARAVRDGRYWLPVDAQHALADALLNDLDQQADAWRRTAVDRALALGRHERTLELVEAAIAIADDHDTTDWQRGYRACVERVQYALGQRDQPPTA